MTGLNIIGIILAPTLFIVSAYYISECFDALWIGLDSYSGGPSRAEITAEAGLVSMAFTLFYIFLNIANLVKVKTMTTKVLSIIALTFNGILLLVNFLILAEPGRASYDEAGATWTLFSILMLAFSIVYLVQSTGSSKTKRVPSQEIIDDIDEVI